MTLAFPSAGKEMKMLPLTKPKRLVYVIDDDADVRKSLHFALATSDITVWPFATPEDFLDQLDVLEPAPVILDFRLRTIDGIQVLQILADRGNRWPVIMFSAYGDIPLAVRAIRLGAIDFVEKPVGLTALDQILSRCFDALSVVIENARAVEDADRRLARLTKREEEILNLLIQGHPNKVVADNLGISHRTVEIHRSNALKKLSVQKLTQVANLMSIRNSSGSARLGNVIGRGE